MLSWEMFYKEHLIYQTSVQKVGALLSLNNAPKEQLKELVSVQSQGQVENVYTGILAKMKKVCNCKTHICYRVLYYSSHGSYKQSKVNR